MFSALVVAHPLDIADEKSVVALADHVKSTYGDCIVRLLSALNGGGEFITIVLLTGEPMHAGKSIAASKQGLVRPQLA